MRNAERIGIVGAGVAGLSAAYRLQRAGARVTVLEEQEHLGGRAWTDRIDGSRVDAGAQLLGSMYRSFLALVRELGLGGDLVRAPGRDALWRDGRAHEVVYGSVTSMLAAGGLSFRTKMRLGTTYVPFLNRHSGALDLAAPERASFAGLDGESIAAWGEREMDREFVEYLVEPQLAAYYGAAAERTSAGFYHILGSHGMDVSLYALRGGIGRVCETLGDRLREGGGEVRTGARVERVEPDEGGVRVLAGEGEERFDAVVVAVPAPRALEILATPHAPLRNWLREVRYGPMLTLALVLDRPLGVRYFGLSFPRRREGRIVSALCVQENKGAGLVPAGGGLLVAYAAPEHAGALLELEPRAVLDRMLADLRRPFPGLEARVTRARVYRWPNGNPVFYPGYLGRLAAFRGGGIEGDSRVVLAGDYLYSPTVEGAVTSAAAAVERLRGRLAG
jgi:protoporphyrinogen/coproporphyrinogen III oxidase